MADKRFKLFGVVSFFDRNVDQYARAVVPDAPLDSLNLAFTEFVYKRPLNRTLLDVGAGSGWFASLVKMTSPDVQVTALDPSINLLNMIEDPSIRKIVDQIPYMNLDPREKFSYIHISNVLHHLVGKNHF